MISDTTVQEKNITFPTDSKLLCRSIEHIVNLGLSSGLKFRQTYKRKAPRLKLKASRYAHARKPGLAKKCTKQLRTLLGRVIREVERQIDCPNALSPMVFKKLKSKVSLARRVWEQNRESKDKVYSMHEPEVSCIAKGKAHKKYEFGSKVGIVSTIRNSFIVAIESFKGNPYDGKTLSSLFNTAEQNTRSKIKTAVLDKGYRGSKAEFPEIKIMISGVEIWVKLQKRGKSELEPHFLLNS